MNRNSISFPGLYYSFTESIIHLPDTRFRSRHNLKNSNHHIRCAARKTCVQIYDLSIPNFTFTHQIQTTNKAKDRFCTSALLLFDTEGGQNLTHLHIHIVRFL